MMDTAPQDNRRDDNDYHKQIRALTEQPANTVDDREFTNRNNENVKNKAPGEEGITSVI